MATEQRPFQGQTGFELTAAILNQPVPQVPEQVPKPVTDVMERCLAKKPGERYQRGSEVKAVLDALAMGGEAARVRITAKLIRVSDQRQVRAQPYEHELSAIMMIQSDLAKNVSQALALALLPAGKDRLASARTVNPEANEADLRGLSLWKTLKRDDLDNAQRYFDLALVKDPSFAPAHEGLAWVWLARRQVSIARTSEACPKAQAAAQQAVALDGLSADAHEALAAVRTGC